MPWSCPTCNGEQDDDVPVCSACGFEKQSWTLQAEQTRVLRLTGGLTKLQVLRGTSDAPLPLGQAAPDGDLVEAEACPVISKDALRALLAAGQGPAPSQRLVARVTPRGKDRAVVVAVEFARSALEERELEGPEPGPAGWFDLPVVCVHGAGDLADLSVPGAALIDVSEDGGAGYAPAVSIRAVRRSRELPTVLVEEPVLTLLEVEDVCFATARAVLLPGGWSASDDMTGLSALAASLEFARKHPARRLLLAGHTDPRGSVADNLVLSIDRARNVHLYLTGQRAAWAADAQARHELRDVQSILKWVAWLRDWDCDPGAIDGDWGKKTRAALDGFRARYNEERQANLATGGKVGVDDWAAFFDLYDDELAFKLKAAPGRLATLRQAITFTDPPYLGCSEHWPTERPGAPAVEAAQRRVDVLFFPAEEVPDLAASPPGKAIYGEGMARRYLTVEDAFREPEPPYGDAPFEDADCVYKAVHGQRAPTDVAPALERSVRHEVPLLGNEVTAAGNVACAAMVTAWRDAIPVIDPVAFAAASGRWAPYAVGLAATDDAGARAGFELTSLGAGRFTPIALVELLERVGPLWVAGTETGRPRVLTGLSAGEDGRPRVHLNDPTTPRGEASAVPFETFAFDMARRSAATPRDDEVPLDVTHS